MKFIRKVFVLFLSLTLALLAAEFLLRAFAPTKTLNRFLVRSTPDPVRKYKLAPNQQTAMGSDEFNVAIHINSQGIRDKEYSTPKPSRTYRICVLGDSMTFGHGLEIEDVYAERLEYLLNQNPPPAAGYLRYEVINTGVGGYYFWHYLRSFEVYDPIYHCDLAIVGFYAGNDFNLFDPDGKMEVYDGQLWRYVTTKQSRREISQPMGARIRVMLRPVRFFLSKNSQLYLYTREPFYQLLYKMMGYVPPRYRLDMNLYKNDLPPDQQEEHDTINGLMGELSRLVKASNAKLLVLIIPDRIQVYDDLWRSSLHESRTNEQEVDRRNPNRRLIRILDKYGIPHVDLLDEMQKDPDVQYYFIYDGHWNAEGSRLAGNRLYTFLSKPSNSFLLTRNNEPVVKGSSPR